MTTAHAVGPVDVGTWMDVAEAAARLKTSKRTLYRLTEDRRVPFRRLPGTNHVRFAPEDIKAIEEAAKVQPLAGRAA